MADASDLQDEALWLGGSYELALELGDRDDARLHAALVAVWRAADVEGCLAMHGEPREYVDVPCTLEQLERHGRLVGTTAFPNGTRVICGVRAVRQESGTDWLVFFIPVGSLERAEPRSAAFPFRGGDSLLWRRPLDRRLSELGRQVYAAVPYRLGLIGPEVTGMTSARKLAGGPPEERWAGYLIPAGDELSYHYADR